MVRRVTILLAFGCAVALAGPAGAQQTALTDEQIRQAEAEVPRLVELLGLGPGSVIADVGAGFGAWTVRFARVVGPDGRVYATDIGAAQVAWLKEHAAREKLSQVTVIEGDVKSTNLPAGCCDGILVRDAYHHFTQPTAMVESLAAALKPGGRLAIIDFRPRPNSQIPSEVPADRLGHGVPVAVVEREVGTVLTHVQTIDAWMPDSQQSDLFLVLFGRP